MGAYLSKEWSEVVTSASPGSPTETTNSGGDENDSDISNSSENGENLPARVGAGFVARRRILDADPRSISGVYQLTDQSKLPTNLLPTISYSRPVKSPSSASPS
jgi:hypothetical protein